MIFKKKKSPAVPSALPDSAASRYLQSRITGVQTWLNRQTPSRRKLLFLTAGVLFGAYCTVLVFAPGLVKTDIPTERIAIPQLPAPPAVSGNITDSSTLDPQLQYLVDSIQRDAEGRHRMDSLEAALRLHKPW